VTCTVTWFVRGTLLGGEVRDVYVDHR
jgi:hypothetical protein